MKNLFTFLLACLWGIGAYASHYIGTGMYYECLGGCTYRIYITHYFDCSGAGVGSYTQPLSPSNPYPAPIGLTVVGNAGCTFSNNGIWSLASWDDITPVCPGVVTQCSSASGTIEGVAEATYYTDYNLCNAACSTVNFSWSSCCYGYSITSGAGGNNIYTGMTIDLANAVCNNSPVFMNQAPTYVEAGITTTFSQAAFDAEGDSLAYTLIPSMQTSSSTVTYSPGYSAIAPLGPTWNVSIDAYTGLLTIAPNPTGAIVTGLIGIQVEEYRLGVSISKIRRDILISVINSPSASLNHLPSYTISNLTGGAFVNAGMEAYPNTALEFDILASDVDVAQLLDYTSNIATQFPGATITGTNLSNPMSLHFSWTPSNSNLNNSYMLKTDIFDNDCPLSGHVSYFQKISVVNLPSSPVVSSISVVNQGGGNYSCTANVIGGTAPYLYSWNNGVSSASASSLYIFNTAGYNNYCVFVTDANSNVSNYYCDSVWVVPTCTAAFTATPTYNPSIPALVNFTYTGTTAVTYTWDFGDGSPFSNLQNPTHTYTSLGIFNACVSMIDGNGCSNSLCQTINIGTGIDLDGYIYTGNAVADSFEVFLIKHDAAGGGTLTAIDSQFVYGSPAYYNFANIQPDIYYTKAAILSSSPNYLAYIPTYHDSSLFWVNATPINFLAVPPTAPSGDIYMVAGANPGGPGFIGGLLAQGANKILQGAAAGKQVILLNNNNQAVAYTYTDVNGAFSFNNLAYGTYKVHPEVMNKLTFENIVTINANAPSITEADMIISHDSIYPYMVTPIIAPSTVFDYIGNVRPNPTQEISYIAFSLAESQVIRFALSNALGQVVWENEMTFSEGKHVQDIDMKAFAKGVYFLHLKDEQGRLVVQKLIKD